jgi:phage repressor protein C with HTH and peptisase S24 domain
MLSITNNQVKHSEHNLVHNVRMTLQDRIKLLFKENPTAKPAHLAKFAKVSRASVSGWMNGGVGNIEGANAYKVAEFFKINPQWLITGEGDIRKTDKPMPEANAEPSGSIDLWDSQTPLDEDDVEIPFYKDVEFAAGDGKLCDSLGRDHLKLRFSKSTLKRQNVQIDSAVCFTAIGNSMEPMLPDGCTVGIDESKKTIVDGKIYAINHAGDLRLKILYKLPNGGIRMRSYNADEYPEEIYQDTHDIRILGRLFWYSVLL